MHTWFCFQFLCNSADHLIVAVVISVSGYWASFTADNLALLSDVSITSVISWPWHHHRRSCMLLILFDNIHDVRVPFPNFKTQSSFSISVKSSERLFGNTHYDLRLLLLQRRGIKILHIPTSWNVLTVIWGMSALLLDVLLRVMYVGLSQNKRNALNSEACW